MGLNPTTFAALGTLLLTKLCTQAAQHAGLNHMCFNRPTVNTLQPF